MRKPKNKTDESQSTNHKTYDELLEKYLPVIHKAAHTLESIQFAKVAFEDLVLVGIRGFREGFMQLTNPSTEELHQHCLSQIQNRMVQQITIHIQ